jgi:hypothetical protein
MVGFVIEMVMVSESLLGGVGGSKWWMATGGMGHERVSRGMELGRSMKSVLVGPIETSDHHGRNCEGGTAESSQIIVGRESRIMTHLTGSHFLLIPTIPIQEPTRIDREGRRSSSISLTLCVSITRHDDFMSELRAMMEI